MCPSALDAAVAAAKQYVDWDVSSETRDQAQKLLDGALSGDAVAVKALLSQFGSQLEFGTAGLRAEMAAGTARMNDLTVIQAAQGIADYVSSLPLEAGREMHSVVIGYDHRQRGAISSLRFAVLSAAAFTAKGIAVHLFTRLACTPLVPFAIRHLRASAGVMVTASHNPKNDDGYKVYAGNGAQIISPVDRDIASRIALPSNARPWGHIDMLTSSEAVSGLPTAYRLPTEALLVRLLQGRGDLLPGLGLDDDDKVTGGIDEELTSAYVAACAASQCRHRGANAAPGGCPLRIAYTAMHGVGRPFAQAMAAAFGLPPYIETPEQVRPDPTFPTVAYPNPEEGAGALALAMATAVTHGCGLILANDPDADRLAVAVEAGPPGSGDFRVLTGNEIGALLADWSWASHVATGGSGSGAWMAVSAVSSQLVRAMAAAEGFGYRPCLTGFKWMGNAMADAEARGERTLFAFEEAIGFACGDAVRDKDGVTAAAVFAEMAQAYARRGETVLGRLAQIYAKYGTHVSNNGYIIVADPAVSGAIFARLRNGGSYWARLPPAKGRGGDGYAIVGVRDLTATPAAPRGWDSASPDGVPALPVSSSGNMLTYTFAGAVNATVTLRTSGTEPKLKWYSEGVGADGDAVRAQLRDLIAAVVQHMLQPEAHGLTPPKL